MDKDNENYKSIEKDEPEYVKDLSPLYIKARRAGAIDMVLSMTHASGTLEGAEKFVSTLMEQYEPIVNSMDGLSKDSNFLKNLRQAFEAGPQKYTAESVKNTTEP